MGFNRVLWEAMREELLDLCAAGAVTAWNQAEYDYAIHIPVGVGSVPALCTALLAALARIGGRVVPAAGGVVILGVLPAMTDACFDLAGVQEWCTPVTPACRLLFLQGGAGHGRFRFAGPTEGHELSWLVRTGGQWTEARVGLKIQGRLGRAVYVLPVTARVPGQNF